MVAFVPLPPILKPLIGAARLTPFGALAGGLLGAVAGGAGKRRRRRRRTLSAGEKADVSFLSNSISKKAAENYLLRR